jgi:hypothetical protein
MPSHYLGIPESIVILSEMFPMSTTKHKKYLISAPPISFKKKEKQKGYQKMGSKMGCGYMCVGYMLWVYAGYMMQSIMRVYGWVS